VSPTAVHIRTRGFQCKVCPEVIRHALKGLPGVLDVVAVPSMRLTSVLYDAERVAVGQLRDRMARCGYDTDVPAAVTG